MKNNENNKTGIVLNRMYTGSYLSTNLGHEVINMFQADNGKHYLYLNSKGNFSKRGGKVGTMLLVRGIGDKRVEIVGLAKNLTPVESAQCTLPKDLGRINKHIQEKQNAFMKEQDIKYGGVPIEDIFDGKGQQSVFISYVTDDKSFFRPNKRIIIIFGCDNDKQSKTEQVKEPYEECLSLNFASTSLHQFVCKDSEPQDWEKLQKICDTETLWTLDNTKVSIPEEFRNREDSLFDICQIKDDENRFSNALSYFIEKYPVLWKNFLQSRLKDINLGEIESVTREENAKVKNEECKLKTGGRIDLLIRTKNCYIVIENKIDSGIIMEDGVSQIQRYYNYVVWLKKEETDMLVNEIKRINKCREKKEEQYKALKNKQGKHGLTWEEELTDLREQIKMLNEELREVEAREFRGFVLSPNYNKPSPEEYEVDGYKYEELLYSNIYSWLEKNAIAELKNDLNFMAFHDAMKKHTFETPSEALYEEMKNRFFSRIQKMTKYFTKSAFSIALKCPRRLYYAYDKKTYANQDLDDDFLKSLAEGGFQVGEFAKLCYGIDAKHTIDTLDADEAIKITKELFGQENVNIAEAAFRSGNLFVRADIIEKQGNIINLIEVKAKSWHPEEESFLAKNGKSTNNAIRPYLYDVAFQKYVVEKALKEMFPEKTFTVKAFLMLADKSRVSTVNGLNQLFKIKDGANGRSVVETSIDAIKIVSAIPEKERVVQPFDVDEICNHIIGGSYEEQKDLDFMEGIGFKAFVEKMADHYCNHKKTDCSIGSKCFSCPFHKKPDDNSVLLDGYRECWKEKAEFKDEDFSKPLIKDLSGLYIGKKRDELVKDGKFFIESLTKDDLKESSHKTHDGLDHYERKWLQIGVATNNEEILESYRSDMDGDVYLDVEGIKNEMATWNFPLHFIDFETSAVALPFYEGMRPYEQIAFQFSHHRVDLNEDGSYRITHAGQFINTEKGHFPNFDFIRALKNELDKDSGTIFRYSNHENTILREIHKQLENSNEEDKDELQSFIESITHYKDGKDEFVGKRDMVDLADLVLKYYFHPIMKGSYSIKVVLPAVLNSSDFIKKKYEEAVYGTEEMPSMNLTKPKAWIEYEEDGMTVKNPYKLLPPIVTYLNNSEDSIEALENDESIANGGAALAAYSKLQFSDDSMTEALISGLLTYCELDTLAMVFIWEYFKNEVDS